MMNDANEESTFPLIFKAILTTVPEIRAERFGHYIGQQCALRIDESRSKPGKYRALNVVNGWYFHTSAGELDWNLNSRKLSVTTKSGKYEWDVIVLIPTWECCK